MPRAAWFRSKKPWVRNERNNPHERYKTTLVRPHRPRVRRPADPRVPDGAYPDRRAAILLRHALHDLPATWLLDALVSRVLQQSCVDRCSTDHADCVDQCRADCHAAWRGGRLCDPERHARQHALSAYRAHVAADGAYYHCRGGGVFRVLADGVREYTRRFDYRGHHARFALCAYFRRRRPAYLRPYPGDGCAKSRHEPLAQLHDGHVAADQVERDFRRGVCIHPGAG